VADIITIEEDTRTIIRIEGGLSINDALELKNSLVNAIERMKPVLIDLNQTSEFDLTAFQLFCSAHRTALNLGIPIRLESRKSSHFLEIIDQIGYPRLLGCSITNPKDCLWIPE